MVSDADLIDRLESLQVSIDGLREDTRKKVQTNRRAIIAAVLIAVFGVIVGTVGVVHGIHADNTRKQRTVAACQQANDQTDRSIVAAEATSDNFIDYLGTAAKANPKTDPVKLREFIEGAKVAQHRVIEKNYPKRDCSPRGIAAYYSPKHT